MSYIALYRKYRPQKFADVLGQAAVVKTLKNQIIGGKISHAYLFCGTRGTGKTSIAKIFAKAINCTDRQNGEPCGICHMCVEISKETSLNVIEIDAASNNGVDNIREIRDEVRYSPTEGEYKVYIIDEVHMLSTGANNALLKTLEEPPAHAIFILATTDPQKIPQTIHSRCQRYDFKRISSSMIAERMAEYIKLENVKCTQEALEQIARLGDGSMRDSLSLLDRCISYFDSDITYANVLEVTGTIDTRSFFELTNHLNRMDGTKAMLVVNDLINEGKEPSQIIMDALAHFRSLLIAQAVEKPEVILDISRERAQELKAAAESIDRIRLLTYVEAFSALQSNARYSPNPRLLLEIEAIRLCNPEILEKSFEEVYNKILKLETEIQSIEATARHEVIYVNSAEQAGKAAEPPAVKRKVALREDLNEVKERFLEIKQELLKNRGATAFAAVLGRAGIGFLDDDSVYVIFDDETNESILKNSPERQELLDNAIAEVTGKQYNVKTILRDSYEKQANGIEFVKAEDGFESLKSSLSEGLGDIDIEFI